MGVRKEAATGVNEIGLCHRLSHLLIRCRHELGLSQCAVGARLGLSQTTVARMERRPDLAPVARVLAVLQLYGREVVVQRVKP